MSNVMKKTMVYLGLAEEQLADEFAAPPTPVAPVAVQPVKDGRAPVTPLPRRTGPSRANTNRAGAEMNEILTVHPRQYADAQQIAESFRDGVPVIINLQQMTDSDARRLIDFASGLSAGLFGKIERVTNKVFLLSPAHVAITGETADEGDTAVFA